jgi:DNA modification methylase
VSTAPTPSGARGTPDPIGETVSTYYRDEQVTLLLGDALEVLRAMPDGSVDCCVTSPPYFGLRDYGFEGQCGLEATPAEYVETMRAVFAEVRRVLADDGTLWLNLGDSYVTGATGTRVSSGLQGAPNSTTTRQGFGAKGGGGLPSKSLIGIPWRVAFALQDDGWILRNDIIWHKPNAMPESMADRLANRHEHMFLLAKSQRYHFDLDAIRNPHAPSTLRRSTTRSPYMAPGQIPNVKARPSGERGANPGDFWPINTRPYADAHFAVMPPELAARCIKAGCKRGGTVLDPFSGSGTTGAAARMLGRAYVGIDLNPDYHDLAVKRFAQGVLDFDTENQGDES